MMNRTCVSMFLIISMQFCIIYYLQYKLNHIPKASNHTSNTVQCDSHEPIDVVYTWVNGSDPRFLSLLHHYSPETPVKEDVNGDRRYAESQELLYSLRSLDKYMPWIRHVYIVTNGQIPSWLNLDTGHVSIVPHENIFLDGSHLPTFSSPAIESHLHRIPGISSRFLYFNDDWLLGASVEYSTFYTPTDGHIFYWEFAVPPCDHLCTWRKVGDGICHIECYTEDCQFDGGDCEAANFKKSNLVKLQKPPKIIETAYGKSLQHTQRLLNTNYGHRQRYVMPHTPILLDVDVISSAWVDFPQELTETSSHKFREGTDLQFEFFFTNYMLEKQQSASLTNTLRKYDSNEDGAFNREELNVMLLQHYHNNKTWNISKVERNNFVKTLQRCSEDYRIDALEACTSLEEFFEHTLRSLPAFKGILLTKVPTDSFYHFGRISSDVDFVINELNSLITYPRKFICLNNDMTHTPEMDAINQRIYKEVALFYERMFPVASKYELPVGEINPPEKYIQEIRPKNRLLPSANNKNMVIMYVLVFCCLLLVLGYAIFEKSCFSRRRFT